MSAVVPEAVEVRARYSRGASNPDILSMVLRALDQRDIRGECFVDVGCGQGDLFGYVRSRFSRYVGIDAVRYEDFPEHAEFCLLDLDSGHMPPPCETADVAAAVEVIEHLRNPSDFHA